MGNLAKFSVKKFKILTIFATMFLGLTICVFSASNNSCVAWAAPLTPEAKSYQVDKSPEKVRVNLDAAKNEGKELATGAKEKAEAALDKVQEKLDFSDKDKENVQDKPVLVQDKKR